MARNSSRAERDVKRAVENFSTSSIAQYRASAGAKASDRHPMEIH
jgi:hypothetical protein